MKKCHKNVTIRVTSKCLFDFCWYKICAATCNAQHNKATRGGVCGATSSLIAWECVALYCIASRCCVLVHKQSCLTMTSTSTISLSTTQKPVKTRLLEWQRNAMRLGSSSSKDAASWSSLGFWPRCLDVCCGVYVTWCGVHTFRGVRVELWAGGFDAAAEKLTQQQKV